MLSLAAIEEREDDSFNAIVTTLGGWPMIDQHWDESGFDLATLLGKLRASSYGFTPLVLMFVSVDERNSVAHRILVSITNNSRARLALYRYRSNCSCIVAGYINQR